MSNQFASLRRVSDIEQSTNIDINTIPFGKKPESILELAILMDDFANVPNVYHSIFSEHYFHFYRYSIADYHRFYQERLDCLKNIFDVSFKELLLKIVATFEPLDIKPLLQRIIECDIHHSSDWVGTLLLIGTIIDHRPDLLTPELLRFPRNEFNRISPIITWVAGQALGSEKITHLDPLLSHNLLEVFLGEMLSDDSDSSAVAVCATHLIVDCFKLQDVDLISASHFARLLYISKKELSNRDQHISQLLNTIISDLSVSDKKDLAAQLMEVFFDAPDFICKIFIDEITRKKNATFIDGWVECVTTHVNESMRYLDAISADIPKRIVCKFPKDVLNKGGNRIRLVSIEVELTNSSFRFCFIIFLIFLLFRFRRDLW